MMQQLKRFYVMYEVYFPKQKEPYMNAAMYKANFSMAAIKKELKEDHPGREVIITYCEEE